MCWLICLISSRYAILRAAYLQDCLNSGQKPLEPGELNFPRDGLDFGIPCAILKNLQTNMEMLPRNIRKGTALTLAVPDLIAYQSVGTDASDNFDSASPSVQSSAPSPLNETVVNNLGSVVLLQIHLHPDSEVDESITIQDSDSKEGTEGSTIDGIASDNENSDLTVTGSKETIEDGILQEAVFTIEFPLSEGEDLNSTRATADSFDGSVTMDTDDSLIEEVVGIEEVTSDNEETETHSLSTNNSDDEQEEFGNYQSGPAEDSAIEEALDEADLTVKEFTFIGNESSMLDTECNLFSDETLGGEISDQADSGNSETDVEDIEKKAVEVPSMESKYEMGNNINRFCCIFI